MEEVYTVHEFAKIMGVPWQQVAAWKRHNQIPAKAITPDGNLVKSIIDPYVEVFKRNAPTDAESNQSTVPAEPQKTQSLTKKSYSPKDKKEAMRLVFKEKYTLEQTAAAIGCSVGAVRQWKAKYQKSKKATSKVMPPKQPQVKKTPAPKESSLDFEDFVRKYWQEESRAVDTLLLPQEISTNIVNHVNDALRYAFDRLQ